jgi:hypothetical protein
LLTSVQGTRQQVSAAQQVCQLSWDTAYTRQGYYPVLSAGHLAECQAMPRFAPSDCCCDAWPPRLHQSAI